MRPWRRRRRRRLALLVAPAALLALAALGAALARRRRRASEAERPLGEPWRCACGQEFLVAGRDRHRVYWLADAGPDDPVLGDACPQCGRGLPAESGAGAPA